MVILRNSAQFKVMETFDEKRSYNLLIVECNNERVAFLRTEEDDQLGF